MKVQTQAWKFFLSELASHEQDPEKLRVLQAEIRRLSEESTISQQPKEQTQEPSVTKEDRSTAAAA